MLALLAPLGLIALVALALPVLIHLIRRSERKDVVFTALQWLDHRNRPRQQLRVHDWPLLLLRLLLLATLALLLAVPIRFLHGDPGSAWVLVSPQIDAAAAHAAIDAPTAEWHWLAPGFPSLDTPRPALTPPASLIREADALLPPATRLSLVVPQTLDQLDAGGLRLAHAVDWRPLPVAVKSATMVPPPPLRVLVRGPAAQGDERRVIGALALAWRATGREVALDDDATPIAPGSGDGLLVWLGGEPDAAGRKWIEAGGRALASAVEKPRGVVVLTDGTGAPWLWDEPIGRGHLFAVATVLTPSALPSLLDPAFPQQLLVQLEPPAPVSSTAEATMLLPQKLEPRPPGPYAPLDRWVALVAALLFLLERAWASRPHRVSP